MINRSEKVGTPKSRMFLTKISQQRTELFKKTNYTTNHMYTTYNYTLIILPTWYLVNFMEHNS